MMESEQEGEEVLAQSSNSKQSGNNVQDHVKNYLRYFKKSRDKVLEIVDKIVNLLTKKSYYSTNKIVDALGSAIKPSVLYVEIDNEIFESFSQLNDLQDQLTNILDVLEETLNDNSRTADNWSFDPNSIYNLLPQLKQQLLLEKTIASLLSGYNDHTADHDALVTMVACFKFPPYLRESDLDHILHM